jgi:hypothetical protein
MTNKIIELPTDEIPPSDDELNLMSWMYKKENTNENEKIITSKFNFEIKIFSLIIIIYVLLNLDFVNNQFMKFIPFFKNNPLFFNILKGFIFAIILFYIFNLKYIKH